MGRTGYRHVEPKSEHHTFLGRAMMKGVNLHTGNGSLVHQYEYRGGAFHSVRPRRIHDRLRTHLIDQGYVAGGIDTSLDNLGNPSHIVYRYERGEDQVVVKAWGPGAGEGERVYRVDHFPHGRCGDGRSTITVDQMISAMSWGH